MVCICSFVCSERERVVCLLQERHKHRQRCFLVKWSSASRTQNSCRLCIKHLHFCFFPSMLCNGWSLYLLATYGLHLNTHLLKLVASSNCVFGVGKKEAGWTHIWQRSGVGEFSEPKSLLPRPPHSSRSRFSIPWFWLWKWQACVFFFSSSVLVFSFLPLTACCYLLYSFFPIIYSWRSVLFFLMNL